MNIREPRNFDKVRAQRQAKQRHKKLRRFSFGLVVVVIALVTLSYGAYLRPLPAVTAKTIAPIAKTEQVALSWPAQGQAAIGVLGQAVMAQTANQTASPTASTAKLMLALAVVKKHPLAIGQTGPNIPITEADVALYNKYISIDGSVTAVMAGQQINQYQALQAALLPSSNNMADTLAVWAYGSMANYHLAANQIAQELGMTSSKFAGDASGFLPETVSTANDLVLLGQAALNEPVIKEIVGQSKAVIPVAGQIRSTNFLLNQNGIIGIKSGNTDQAGGCFIFAAERQILDGKTVTVVGAIMGAPTYPQAALASLPLLDSFYNGFSALTVVPKGTVVARYDAPWGAQTTATTAQDTNLLIWRGSKASLSVQAGSIKSGQKAGDIVGQLVAGSSLEVTKTNLVTAKPLSAPTWQWRIWRY